MPALVKVWSQGRPTRPQSPSALTRGCRIDQEGVAVRFIKQHIQQSLAISHRGYILEGGRVALAGSSAELVRDERLHRV